MSFEGTPRSFGREREVMSKRMLNGLLRLHTEEALRLNKTAILRLIIYFNVTFTLSGKQTFTMKNMAIFHHRIRMI